METHGLVVKIKGKSCIVLTPEGEYKEVPLPKGGVTRVGQEISLQRKKNLPYLRYFMVAASLLIVVLTGQLYLGQTPPAAAYLTIDINPSVELAVSVDGKVVSTRGLNSDGEKVLAEVKIKGRDLREAVELIIARAVIDQYLKDKEDNVILATLTVEGDAEPVVDLDSVYEAIRNPVESGGVDAEVIIEPVKPEMRQEAAKSGISTGRYLLLQKSDKKGVPVSVSEISTLSLGKLEKEKKVSFIDLMDEGDKDDDSDDDSKERKEGKVVKRGIYVARQNAEENSNDKSGRKAVISGKKRPNTDNDKSAAPERNEKRHTEEKQDRSERRNNNGGKGKVDDGDRTERDDDGRGPDGHRQHGRGN